MIDEDEIIKGDKLKYYEPGWRPREGVAGIGRVERQCSCMDFIFRWFSWR